MIKAKGTKNGKPLLIEYKNGAFLFDGKVNYKLEAEVVFLLSEKRPFAGTYFPEKDMEPLNIVSVFKDYFFDRPTTVETDEDIELPKEDGEIY